jgi:predicted RNase H-like nuclease (RuvC/YqgF family)
MENIKNKQEINNVRTEVNYFQNDEHLQELEEELRHTQTKLSKMENKVERHRQASKDIVLKNRKIFALEKKIELLAQKLDDNKKDNVSVISRTTETIIPAPKLTTTYIRETSPIRRYVSSRPYSSYKVYP